MNNMYANKSIINAALNSSIETTINYDSDVTHSLITTIFDFSEASLNVLSGDMYNRELSNLTDISNLLTKKNNLALAINEMNKSCFNLLLNYLAEDDNLDMLELPKLNKELNNKKIQLTNLRNSLNPNQDNSLIYVQITQLESEIKELSRIITKTEGLQNISSTIIKKQEEILFTLNSFEKEINELDGKVSKSVGATIAVGAISILSGIAKVLEMGVDAMAYFTGALVTLDTEGCTFLGNELNNENIKMKNEKDEKVLENINDFIGTDYIGNAEKYFFENTEIGSSLNINSNETYDSDTMQNLKEATKTATIGATEVAIGALTSGRVTSTIIGGFVSIGEEAEKIAQSGQNIYDNNGKILLNGAAGALEGAIAGGAGIEGRKTIENLVKYDWNVGNFVRNTIPNISKSAFEGINNLPVNTRTMVYRGLTSDDSLFDTGADAIASTIRDGSIKYLPKNLWHSFLDLLITIPGTKYNDFAGPIDDSLQAVGINIVNDIANRTNKDTN